MIDESKFALMVLDNHLKTVISLQDIGMVWWVSGTVMCIGILKTALEYIKTNEKIPQEILWFISIFLMSIIFFGGAMCYLVIILKNEYNHIIGPVLEFRYPTNILYDILIYGIFIGSTSFFLFFCCWIYLIFLKKDIKKIQK